MSTLSQLETHGKINVPNGKPTITVPKNFDTLQGYELTKHMYDISLWLAEAIAAKTTAKLQLKKLTKERSKLKATLFLALTKGSIKEKEFRILVDPSYVALDDLVEEAEEVVQKCESIIEQYNTVYSALSRALTQKTTKNNEY